MTLNEWEFSYEGLVMGGTNAYGVLRVDGLAPPDTRIDEVAKAENHGSFVRAEWLAARRIVLEGDIFSTPSQDFEALVTAWRKAFAPKSVAGELRYRFEGDGSLEKVIYCHPTRRSMTIDIDYAGNKVARWQIELIAGDPRIYDSTVQSVSTGRFSEGGFGFPLSFPFGFIQSTGSTGTGAVQVNNAGMFATLPKATIRGPLTNPSLRNLDTGKELSFSIDLVSGQSLDIDFKDRTVQLGGSNRYNTLTQETSDWWQLQPGINNIALRATAGTGNFTLTWQSAWI